MRRFKLKDKHTKIAITIAKAANGEDVNCPFCGAKPDIKFYANKNQIGFALMKCTKCGESGSISRMRFKPGTSTIPM